MNYSTLREKYNNFIYKSYDISYNEDSIEITYHFEIEGLTSFNPTIKINTDKYKDKSKDLIEKLVFNIGMVEVISYWKAVCSKNLIVKAGYLDDDQISFFKKLFYNGLGEFFYRNDIKVDYDSFINIKSTHEKEKDFEVDYEGFGNLIPLGGGKDSNVTLEILKDYDNTAVVTNPKEVHFECFKLSCAKDFLVLERTIDKNLLDLNKQGYLNGHTPFSAHVAFICFLAAYLLNKKYIVLSNEGSANEETVLGTNINHQYSKSYEYEMDFNNYAKKYFKVDIKYFSLLRCLNELQIGLLFSKYEKYHKVFRSCNLGSKETPWKWCCKCPKCLFTFIIMAAFNNYDKVIDIFGKDLLDDIDMLPTLKDLLGETNIKPFECIGTVKEVKEAMSLISKNNTTSKLVKYYLDNYDVVEPQSLKEFNNENNIPSEYLNLVRKELDKYVG